MGEKPVCDILTLQWKTSGRDIEIVRPVLCALEDKGYNIVYDSMFRWRYAIQHHRPKLLILSDAIGAGLNVKAAKYAKTIGLPLVTFISEGDIIPEYKEFFLYGWNKEKVLNENIHFHWSVKTREMNREVTPDQAHKIAVSGATGFDRYKIFPFLTKEQFLKKYNKDFKKVVGITSFGFQTCYPSFPHYNQYVKIYGENQMQRFRDDSVKLREILKNLIASHPDVLFLLKMHPGIDKHEFHLTEFHGIENSKNVIKLQHEEQLGDCLSASDFWIAYESTTCLEAWVMNKQTCLVNPSGPDFLRSQIHSGSPVYQNLEELKTALEKFYSGTLPGFHERLEARRKVVRDIIQWDDGKNHLRAVYYIEKLLQSKKVENLQPNYNGLYKNLKALGQGFAFLTSPVFAKVPAFKHYAYGHKIFDESEINLLNAKYFPAIKEFDRKNQLTTENIRELEETNSYFQPNQK